MCEGPQGCLTKGCYCDHNKALRFTLGSYTTGFLGGKRYMEIELNLLSSCFLPVVHFVPSCLQARMITSCSPCICSTTSFSDTSCGCGLLKGRQYLPPLPRPMFYPKNRLNGAIRGVNDTSPLDLHSPIHPSPLSSYLGNFDTS